MKDPAFFSAPYSYQLDVTPTLRKETLRFSGQSELRGQWEFRGGFSAGEQCTVYVTRKSQAPRWGGEPEVACDQAQEVRAARAAHGQCPESPGGPVRPAGVRSARRTGAWRQEAHPVARI